MAHKMILLISAAASLLLASTNAQTFQRLGACPTLGCIFPPDQYVLNLPPSCSGRDRRLTGQRRADFLAGQFFDIRLEVHAPLNGSEANGGIPDPRFTFTIAKDGSPQNASLYFNVDEPRLERWNFTWYEGGS